MEEGRVIHVENAYLQFRILRNSGFRQDLRPFIPMILQIYTSVLAMQFNSLSKNLLCSPPPVVNDNAIV